MSDLWQRVQSTSEAALAAGHLLPIRTQCHVVTDAGIDFQVRVVESLTHKVASPPAGESSGNPFLPYAAELFVADLSATHVALLNKFMVVPDHLLIVTREFQSQADPLTAEDFDAWAQCLCAYDSIGFYNSTPLAGASQPHRHMQLIPRVAEGSTAVLPIEGVLVSSPVPSGEVAECASLPFAHRWYRFSDGAGDSADSLSAACQMAYAALIQALGWWQVSVETAYNLQVTREWMMLVPRRQECFEDISLNALAYLGGLLVRDEAQLQELQRAGPMRALMATAGSVSL